MASEPHAKRPSFLKALGNRLVWIIARVLCNFHEVIPGVLYRSGAGTPRLLCMICHRFGIRTVMDFRGQTPVETHSIDEAKALTAIGVTHFHTPTHQVPSADVVERFLEIMDDPTYYPVLIHCSHGCGRTGVFTAIYRMEYQGWSNQEALKEARRKSGSLPGNKGFRDDNRKAKFLLAYRPRSAEKRP